MKKYTPKKVAKPRNYVACNPLLKKGGAHTKAKSGARFKSKQKMLKEARERSSSRDYLRLFHFLDASLQFVPL
ncbi:hypothetical protein P3339_15020 [Microbulbifer sp. MLAF003]|uniref:hypothetical protein n=1 Tax=Microbulbifer TaxID=48073 RepID=UPI0003760FDE|nr:MULTISPECIES: hypothetical protein [Microbulbifer]WHI49779.1 hypothetical protein P3339_15020 [Microbulbifer sp. MLAF003]